MTSTISRHTGPSVVDESRWPGINHPGGSAARAAIAQTLFRAAVARLPLTVRLPDGQMIGAGGPGAPEMTLHRPQAFFRRMGSGGLIGFGEAYMAGEWDSPDLTGLLTVFADHVSDLVPPRLQRLRRLAVAPASRPPTIPPRTAPGRTSTGTTTCPTSCSRCSWTTP